SSGLLPAAHDSVPWSNTVTLPWTEVMLNYYLNTNILTCPAFSQLFNKSPFNYFMGARAAYITTGTNASVSYKSMAMPSQYILSGDNNFAFEVTDADPDNY